MHDGPARAVVGWSQTLKELDFDSAPSNFLTYEDEEKELRPHALSKTIRRHDVRRTTGVAFFNDCVLSKYPSVSVLATWSQEDGSKSSLLLQLCTRHAHLSKARPHSFWIRGKRLSWQYVIYNVRNNMGAIAFSLSESNLVLWLMQIMLYVIKEIHKCSTTHGYCFFF